MTHEETLEILRDDPVAFIEEMRKIISSPTEVKFFLPENFYKEAKKHLPEEDIVAIPNTMIPTGEKNDR